MKKNFSLNVANKKPARQVDAIKHEINKYISRERRKKLPEGSDFWDFICKIGPDEESAEDAHLKEFVVKIDELVAGGKEEFFIAIKSTPRTRQKK